MIYKMNQYFPNSYESSDGNVKLKLDLFNYATKADVKGATDLYTSNLAGKLDLSTIIHKIFETNFSFHLK